jgi:small Trp-rich protein
MEEFAMWFLMLGLLGVALKVLEFGVVANWSWWVVLAPFGLAAAWWAWADASGYTKRKAVERDNARRQERIERQRSNLGMLNSRSSRKR